MSQAEAQPPVRDTGSQSASFVPFPLKAAKTDFVTSQRKSIFRFRHVIVLVYITGSALFSADSKPSSSASADGKQHMLVLQAGSVTERKLLGAESHNYLLTVSTGQLLYTCVDQLGIDVVLTLYSPARSRLVTINRYARGRGTEQIWWAAETTGIYRLQVRSRERDGIGSYRLRVAPLREALEGDRSHATAQLLFAEAWQLREQGTPLALREATGKLEAVLAYWRATGNQREQANLLNILGEVHYRLRDDRQALDFYRHALPLNASPAGSFSV